MDNTSNKTRSPAWFHRVGLMLVVGALALAPTACGLVDEAIPDVGALNIYVVPPLANVTVTGPDGYNETFRGSQMLADLKPGMYTAKASLPVFGNDANEMAVVVGVTSYMSLVLHW